MTRIIAGLARGRGLAVPPRGTRPTSDRAREALFNTVAGLIDLSGARVLDLFAGSGAVGLEALSQGAASVVLVESDRAACELIAANVVAVGLPGTTLLRQSAESFVTGVVHSQPFDLVFADPPYALQQSVVDELLTALTRHELLVDGGLMVLERSARDCDISWPPPLVAVKQRRYGEAMLWYGRMNREGE